MKKGQISINRADLRAKNPVAVLKYLYATAPKKFTALAKAQGVTIEEMDDAENLGYLVKDRETDFNMKRFLQALKISSREILAAKDSVKIFG